MLRAAETYFGGHGPPVAPMPDVAFEYKKLFHGARIEHVFDAVLEWLGTKGAKVRKAERPARIETLYGREDVPWNWDPEMKRTVDFEIVATKEYVGLSVWQAPVRSTVKRVLESPVQANISWQDWLNGCWAYVQGKVGAAPATPGTPMRIPSGKAAGPAQSPTTGAASRPAPPPPPPK